MKRPSTARLIWFFLGGFGGHRFYLGQPALGAVYLCAWPLVLGGVPYYLAMPALWLAVMWDGATLKTQVARANDRIVRKAEARTQARLRDEGTGHADFTGVDSVIARYAAAAGAVAEPSRSRPPVQRSFGRRGI